MAKNRSSRSPIRSRTTPTNHKKAIPANGMRFSAIDTVARRRALVSHAPGSAACAGTEILSSTSAAISSTEKMIPAAAAARGVLSELPARSGPRTTTPSVTASTFRCWLGRRPGRRADGHDEG